MNLALPNSIPPENVNEYDPRKDDYYNHNQEPDAATVRYFENLIDSKEASFKSDQEKMTAQNEAVERLNSERSGMQSEAAFFRRQIDAKNAAIAIGHPPLDRDITADIKVTDDTLIDEIVYADDRADDIPNGKGKFKKKPDLKDSQNQVITAISREPAPSLAQHSHSREKGSGHGHHKTSEIARDSDKAKNKKQKQQPTVEKFDSGNVTRIRDEVKNKENRTKLHGRGHQENNNRHVHDNNQHAHDNNRHAHDKKHHPHPGHGWTQPQLTAHRKDFTTTPKHSSTKEKPKVADSKHHKHHQVSEDLKKQSDKRDKKEKDDHSRETIWSNGAAFAKTDADTVSTVQQANSGGEMHSTQDGANAQETLAGRMSNLLNELGGVVEKLQTEGPNGKSISLDLSADKLKSTTIQLVTKPNGGVAVRIDTKSLNALTIINSNLVHLQAFFHQKLPYRPLDLDIQFSRGEDLDEESENSNLNEEEIKERPKFRSNSDMA